MDVDDATLEIMGVGDKPGNVFTEGSFWNFLEEWLGGFYKKGSSESVTFQIEFVALAGQTVSLVFIAHGPSFETIETPTFKMPKKHTGWGTLTIPDSLLKKGTYTVTVILKSTKTQSGPNTICSFNLWVF